MQHNFSFTEFGVHLAELTVDPQGPMAIRQLASVLLRQYVEAHWCQHAEKFRLPETVENVSSTKYTDDNKVLALSLFLLIYNDEQISANFLLQLQLFFILRNICTDIKDLHIIRIFIFFIVCLIDTANGTSS